MSSKAIKTCRSFPFPCSPPSQQDGNVEISAPFLCLASGLPAQKPAPWARIYLFISLPWPTANPKKPGRRSWKPILFPAVCGRVCHHPCETDCNRKEYDEPLAINALERFLGDWGMKEGRGTTREGEKKRRESRSSAGARPDFLRLLSGRREVME